MRPCFSLLWLLGWCVAGGAAARAEVAQTERPPNIVILLADDLGYGDLGCYGSPIIATPHLDRMAAEGVRLTSCYAAAPFCSPSRAALLTGRLPARCGVPYVLFPAEHHGLPEAEITLAEWLRERGYATACIGKWHLGADAPFHPQRHGFDLFYGVPYSNDALEWPLGEPFQQVMGLEPLPLLEGAQIVEAPVDQSLLTRRYTERAVQFLREHRDRPLLLYLAHTMPHIPQYASPEFAGRSRGGLYGDVVEELDWSTGVILETLRELHLSEQTLVVFTSDNGAPVRRPAAQPTARPPRGERFPGRSLTGSNGPLRGGKGQTWEGGVRVPCLVWRPGTIPAGRVLEAPVSLMDLFPTAAALAGAPLPADRAYDGRNIAPLLAGKPLESHEPRWIPHYFGYQLQAVRSGDWKLLVEVHTRPQPRPVSLWYDHQPQLFERQHRLLARAELYDLSRDVGESAELAAAHPEVVARLAAQARAFDAALQADCRPLEFAPGPPPPPPRTIRTAETDLTPWRRFHLPVPDRSAAP
jgi:arylsulfatase A-like enzyme